MKEERGCDLHSPSRFVADPQRRPPVQASRTKERKGPLAGQEALAARLLGALKGGSAELGLRLPTCPLQDACSLGEMAPGSTMVRALTRKVVLRSEFYQYLI